MALTLSYTHASVGVVSEEAYVKVDSINNIKKGIRTAPSDTEDGDGNVVVTNTVVEEFWTCDVKAGVYHSASTRGAGRAPVSNVYKSGVEFDPALPVVEQAYAALKGVSVLSGAEDC